MKRTKNKAENMSGKDKNERGENSTEDSIYNTILDAWKSFSISKQDSTTWEGRAVVKLMKMLKDQKEPSEHTVRNGLLLILALFSDENRGIDLRGNDLHSLNSHEKESILSSLRDLFNLHPEDA